MKKIIVNGGKPLVGEISVSGSKNAALPIVFACILTNGVSEIENLPDIGDLSVALSLLRSFGAVIDKRENITYIDTRSLTYVKPNGELVKKIRASTYLMGACLARFGICPIMDFGGCAFSHRPIDMHISAFESLGARLNGETLYCQHPCGAVIEFDKASVGATVNSLLLAVSSEGESIIRGCAVEPHIDSLIAFLNSCGAKVTRCGREMRVIGGELHGGRISVIGDMIEAGSYLVLSLLTGGKIDILNSPIEDMSATFNAMAEAGAELSVASNRLSGKIINSKYFSVTASPHPGFPTDLQPIIAPLMSHLRGGEIIDTVWQTRFGYLKSLSDFGVSSRVEQNRAEIMPSEIICTNTRATDLRGGMAALMCALVAGGQSEIYSAETILRGYENLEKKLSAIGAELIIKDFL